MTKQNIFQVIGRPRHGIPVVTKAKHALILGAIRAIDYVLDGLERDGLAVTQRVTESAVDGDGLVCVRTLKIAWAKWDGSLVAGNRTGGEDPRGKDDFTRLEEEILGSPQG